jgi:hypothetical protein
MSDTDNFASPVRRTPWNKGKLIGARPPLRSKHVWSIRTRLQVEGRVRDLAMFNLAIDSKLRGCDVVALKVEDIAPNLANKLMSEVPGQSGHALPLTSSDRCQLQTFRAPFESSQCIRQISPPGTLNR